MQNSQFMHSKLSAKAHSSWLVAFGSFSILLGIALAFVAPISFANPGWLIASLALLIVTAIGRTRLFLIVAVLAGLLLGLWRGALEKIDLQPYQFYLGKEVHLKGVITQDPTNDSSKWQVQVGGVKVENKSLPGQVWASVFSHLKLKRSDHVELVGKLRPGFGGFPASMSFAKLVSAKRQKNGDIPLQARDVFATGVHHSIREPEASLGLGYLVGQKHTLPKSLTNNLQIVGLTHVVVASGYNLTILVRLARRLFVKASKYLAALSAGTMMLVFILITGFSPSMVRAGIVAGLSLAAWYYGRRIHPLVLLPFSAAITVLITPLYIWGDVGWYLSFAAFAGVIILAPLITSFFHRSQERPGTVKQIFIETVTAQLVTLPIIAFTFGHYSLFALPANLLVLPFVPLAMVFTFVAGLAGLLIPGLATFFGAPASALLGYMASVINKLASLPLAQGQLNFNVLILVISYFSIILLGIFLWHKTKHDFSKDNIIE